LFGIYATQRPFQIVTEFCAGGCCFELLHNCDHIDLVWGQKLKMCLDVASGMDYLHKFNPQIIHRDLKSLNLLLRRPIDFSTDVPHVKVSDFGLARIKEHAEEDWGKMTIAAGTCHWMAPEVVSGHRYDERADVYSYAMILFEVLCREIPFEEVEPANVCSLVLRGARPDLEAVPPDCPRPLVDLMTSCWAMEAAQRPSFGQILEILGRIAPPVA
jgi:serine/threonine protein kinase